MTSQREYAAIAHWLVRRTFFLSITATCQARDCDVNARNIVVAFLTFHETFHSVHSLLAQHSKSLLLPFPRKLCDSICLLGNSNTVSRPSMGSRYYKRWANNDPVYTILGKIASLTDK